MARGCKEIHCRWSANCTQQPTISQQRSIGAGWGAKHQQADPGADGGLLTSSSGCWLQAAQKPSSASSMSGKAISGRGMSPTSGKLRSLLKPAARPVGSESNRPVNAKRHQEACTRHSQPPRLETGPEAAMALSSHHQLHMKRYSTARAHLPVHTPGKGAPSCLAAGEAGGVGRASFFSTCCMPAGPCTCSRTRSAR